jgi:hypothetical protein
LDSGSDCRANLGFWRSQFDGARRFEQGVHQAALVPAADEESAGGKTMEDQGLGCVGTAHAGMGKGILYSR